MSPTVNKKGMDLVEIESSDSGIDSIDSTLQHADEEAIVKCLAQCRIPSTYGGTHRLHIYKNNIDQEEHMAIVFGNYYSTSLNLQWEGDDEIKRRMRGAMEDLPESDPTPPLVRIHSCCFTGETLGSTRCDCAEQLQEAMKIMSVQGGIIIYMKQEGRGIGLADKLLAYNLIDMGHDTLSANLALGHPADARTYNIATAILKDFNIQKVRLLTNNPHKIKSLKEEGIIVVERLAMIPSSWKEPSSWKAQDRDGYLMTKVQRMGHETSNMYTNHRMFVKSLDSDQLLGKVYLQASDIPMAGVGTTDCGFLQYANCNTAKGYTWLNGRSHAENNPDCQKNPIPTLIANADSQAQYYPCGLVANAMFSDTISDLTCIGNCRISSYQFTQTGIAWPEDNGLYAKTQWATAVSNGQPLNQTVNKLLIPPPQWRTGWPDIYGNGYTADNLPDLAKWERFQVWMRKAGLPTARKLWGRNTTETMDAGTWQVSVTDVWDCVRFSGRKALVFAETGVLGPRNDFMSHLFFAVGAGSLLAGIFLVLLKPRTTGDLSMLSWNRNE
ncbi:GTP cyclohydrolase II [Boothiomyces sp. JEL0838]|nr:GTP cyclohydrolase II [Boothiomyces sp. JEL0838]